MCTVSNNNHCVITIQGRSGETRKLMATSVLCRRVPRLRCLPGLRRDVTQAQHLHEKPGDDSDEKNGMKGVLQHQDSSSQRGYRLHYNPSQYPRSLLNIETTWSKSDNDKDEPCLSALAPSFRQQRNQYSVSCSTHLSSTKNTLLDLAFNKSSEPEIQSLSQHHKKAIPPDVKVDTRAFHKCRAEYSLYLNQRPSPVEWEKAQQLLQKVTVLKRNMKPSDVSSVLLQLSHVHPDKRLLVRNDHRFNMLLQYSVDNLHLFNLFQLLDVLQAFVWLDMPSAHTILRRYEVELSRRANQMNLHQLLLAADLWRCIGKQVPRFLKHLYESVHLYLGQVGIPELVQLLYIIGEGRHCPKDLIHPLQQLLMDHLQHLLPEEVGTVCLALFKSQTSLSELAVTRIVDKAHSVVEDMSDFAVVNVMKYLRFSYLFHKAWLQAMAQEVPRRAAGMGVQGLMHVMLACSALHYHNDNILMGVASRVPSVVPHCRSKDSCKLLWAFGTLGFPPVESPNLYPSLIEGLRQQKAEFNQYPEHLLSGLLGLAFVSEFPEDLLEFALSPDFVNLALKSTQLDLKKDLHTLDGTVALELPQWTGPRLSHELRQEVVEMMWTFVQSSVCQNPEVQEAESALADLLGGEDFVCKRMILPHTRSIDLEVHLDAAGQPIPVNKTSCTDKGSSVNSSSKHVSHQGWGQVNIGVTLSDELLLELTNTKMKYKKDAVTQDRPTFLHRVERDEGDNLFDTGAILTGDMTDLLTKPSNQGVAPQDSKRIKKLAVQVCNRNHFCYQSEQLLGLHAMKRRQLKLAGYRVVDVSHKEWFPMLRRSRAEKLAYLHRKIYNCE